MSHTPYDLLNQKIAEANRNQVVVGAHYCHWKDPATIYEVLGIGFLEWSEEIVVTYRPIGQQILWTRRLHGEDGWLTPVDREGDDKRRFIPVE